jgi:hypothetical protein
MKINLSIITKFVILLCIVVILGSFINSNTALAAALCYGSSCHGKNPDTMGCGPTAYYGAIKSLYRNSVKIGEVHNRYSGTNGCLAQWERTLNLSSNQYAEGSIRWGGVNYNSGWQTVSSPGIIGYGATVYTPMYGTNSGIGPSLNCGSLSLTGPIYPPNPPPGYVSGTYKTNNCKAN